MSTSLLQQVLGEAIGDDESLFDEPEVNFGLLDEYSKREIRRAILTAVAVPGYQVPFGSREMPVARGWDPVDFKSHLRSSALTTW